MWLWQKVVFMELRALGCVIESCGSRVTCQPAPTDTDEDHLVEITGGESAVAKVVDFLAASGLRWEGSTEHYQTAANEFMSWRRDDINLIVTASAEFARRHRAATAVCTRLNVMAKDDRVALFQAVLYGNIEKAPQSALTVTGFSQEMQEALHADAEKLSAITGVEHRVEFFDVADELLV